MDNISPVHHLTSFCGSLIGYVLVACDYQKDVGKLEHRSTSSQVKSNECHSKVSAE